MNDCQSMIMKTYASLEQSENSSEIARNKFLPSNTIKVCLQALTKCPILTENDGARVVCPLKFGSPNKSQCQKICA